MDAEKVLKHIFDGAVYLYTLSLIAAALFLLVRASIEASNGSYWYCLLGLIGSAASFSIVILTTRYLTRQEEE